MIDKSLTKYKLHSYDHISWYACIGTDKRCWRYILTVCRIIFTAYVGWWSFYSDEQHPTELVEKINIKIFYIICWCVDKRCWWIHQSFQGLKNVPNALRRNMKQGLADWFEECSIPASIHRHIYIFLLGMPRFLLRTLPHSFLPFALTKCNSVPAFHCRLQFTLPKSPCLISLSHLDWICCMGGASYTSVDHGLFKELQS